MQRFVKNMEGLEGEEDHKLRGSGSRWLSVSVINKQFSWR